MKIKKIIHLSDLHIRTYQMHDLYKLQFKRVIIDIKTKVKSWGEIERDEIRIVITGDIGHQKINISNEQLLLTSWFLGKLSDIGKVVIIPGNHDFLENNVQRVDSITPVVELLNNDIEYYKDGGVYSDNNIEWVVYSLYQHNERPQFTKKNDKLYVGLFHGPIQGMTTDTGFTFEDGYNRLNFVDLDLLLCGDIHKRQSFKLPNGGKGVMIGSLIQQNFGEKIGKHGYGIYDVENDEYDFVDIINEQPFLHFKINDLSDLENDREILINAD